MVLATGCLAKPAPHTVQADASSDGTTMVDATPASGDGGAISDASPALPTCATGITVLYSSFDGTATGMPACGGGNLSTINAIVQDGGGSLILTPSAAGASAYCDYDPFPSSVTAPVGVIVRASSALLGANDTTYFQMYAGGQSVAFRLSVDTMLQTQLAVYDAGQTGHPAPTANLPMYWRFTFENATHVSADYSTNGTMWQSILPNMLISGGTVRVLLGIVSMSGKQNPAAFDALYYCQ